MKEANSSFGLPTFEDLRPTFLKAPLNLWVRDGWSDVQVGWFVNLLKASLRSDLLGYLPLCAQPGCKNCPSCLWRVAGARNQGFFVKESPVVIAAFGHGQIDGRRVLYFPQLIQCLTEQQRHKRSKSKSATSGDLFSETCASFPQNGPRSSPSSSPSEVVSESQNITIKQMHDTKTQYSEQPYKFARCVIQILGIPATGRNLEVIEQSIRAEAAYAGLSLTEAANRITKAAIEDRSNGKPIDKFYFEDTKWRNSNGGTRKTGAAAERSERSKRNILDGFAASARRRDASDGVERQK
jgi:hypothetical protein